MLITASTCFSNACTALPTSARNPSIVTSTPRLARSWAAARNARTRLPASARDRVAANEEPRGIAGQPKRLAQRLLDQPSAADARLLGVGTRCPDPAPGPRVPVVIDNQRTLAAATVRVREDVLVHPALVSEEI